MKQRTSTAPLPSSDVKVDVVRHEEEGARKEEEFGEVVRDLLGEESHERWSRLKEKKRVESGEFDFFSSALSSSSFEYPRTRYLLVVL